MQRETEMGKKIFLSSSKFQNFRSAYFSAEEISGHTCDSLSFPLLQFYAHKYVYIFKHVEILWGEYWTLW